MPFLPSAVAPSLPAPASVVPPSLPVCPCLFHSTHLSPSMVSSISRYRASELALPSTASWRSLWS